MPTPESFLIDFHRAHPGCTSDAYGRGRIDGNGSSYDLLADAIPADLGGRLVLDLGCGDGHLLELLADRGTPAAQLVGLDLSEDELRLARGRGALVGARLIQGPAQSLPQADCSVAVVLSSLAFMLMDDVEQVVAEIARVLPPGGVFATLVGGGPKVGDSFELFLDLLMPILKRVGNPAPRMGDRRCQKDAGLHELLGSAAGFDGPPRIDDFAVDLGGTSDQVWRTLSTIYEMFELAPEAKRELRAAFVPRALALADDGLRVPCTMFVRRVIAVRADPAGPGR